MTNQLALRMLFATAAGLVALHIMDSIVTGLVAAHYGVAS